MQNIRVVRSSTYIEGRALKQAICAENLSGYCDADFGDPVQWMSVEMPRPMGRAGHRGRMLVKHVMRPKSAASTLNRPLGVWRREISPMKTSGKFLGLGAVPFGRGHRFSVGFSKAGKVLPQ